MIRQSQHGLVYYQFASFANYPLHQAVFTRQGGVSPSPWNSLNFGGSLGDSRENIITNRERAFACFKLPVQSIFDVWQIHGNKIICTEKSRPLDSEHSKADAIFTNIPGITLFMRFADCVPIFFYDPRNRVIGIAHAGRVGTINRIARDCVKTMGKKYGSIPADIIAAIGPSIGPDHYEVKEDVLLQVNAEFPNSEELISLSVDGRTYLDLWKANQEVLHESGVEQVEMAGICTACNTTEWFSHRAENGKTGRFGALLALQMEEN
jgi:YfiH family protein